MVVANLSPRFDEFLQKYERVKSELEVPKKLPKPTTVYKIFETTLVAHYRKVQLLFFMGFSLDFRDFHFGRRTKHWRMTRH